MPTPQAQMFLDWSTNQLHEITPQGLIFIEAAAETLEGRERIAQSYVVPAQQRLHRALQNPSRARRLCLIIEGLIQCFPIEERFCPPLITLREVLIDLYGFLSPNYERIPDEGEDWKDEAPTPVEPEPEYTGPRPTRFERLFNED